MASKRKGDTEPVDERHVMRIMPLGAGNEVGRSCIILKFQGKTIMLDCGVHPVCRLLWMGLDTTMSSY